jgi:type II secretory pathway pseudopilin PulG
MSTLGIVLIAVAAVLVLLLLGGFVAGRRHHATREAETAQHIAEADRALEHARAADKGWDRAALEAAARDAIEGSRPGWAYEELVLVLVDDRPGIEQDRAHFVASGAGGDARLILARTETGWSLERID